MKTYLIIIILVVSFALGFWLRSLKIEEVKYVTLPAVSGTVPIDTPKAAISHEISSLPIIYWKHDTTLVTPDTAAIIDEFLKEKKYDLTLFDDKEKGKLEVEPTVQFNGLSSMSYTYTPIQKEIVKKRKFEPYASASYSTLDMVGVGGGFFYNNLGLEYQYQRSFENKYGHLFGVKIKF